MREKNDNIVKMDPKAIALRNEFVGRWANFWLGYKYFHNGVIVEFVPAGKLPLKKYWAKVADKESSAPRPRGYDSVLVMLKDGTYSYPPLDAHREVGVI